MRTDAVDAEKHLCARTDERRTANGAEYLSVLDPVALADGKVEFTGERIDGAAPIAAAYSPSPMVRIISSGSSLPGQMKVLVMREVGAKV